MDPEHTFEGPFASIAGIGRAEPHWARLNRVNGVVGRDALHDTALQHGTSPEEDLGSPKVLSPEIMSGCVDGLLNEAAFDVLIVGAG